MFVLESSQGPFLAEATISCEVNRRKHIIDISTKIEEKNTYLQEHPRSSTDVALKEVSLG